MSVRSQDEGQRILRAVNDTAEDSVKPSESNSEQSGVNPIIVIAGVVTIAGIGGVGYYFMKKKR